MKQIILSFLFLFLLKPVQSQTVIAGWKLTTDSVQCLSRNMFFGDETSIVSSGNYIRTWYYGDGDSCHCAHANHVYKAAGKYEIKLVVESNGKYDSMSHWVTVLPSIKPMYTTSDYIVCRGTTFILEDTSTNNYGAQRFWKLGDGSVDTASKIYIRYQKPGIYIPTLIYTYTNGCSDSNDNYNLEVIPSAVSSIEVNQAKQCITNNDYIFTDKSSVDSGITYYRSWISNTINSSDSIINFKSTLSSKSSIILRDSSDNGCITYDTSHIIIYEQPNISWTYNPATVCQGDSISLSTFGSLIGNGYDSIYYGYFHNSNLIKYDSSAIISGIKDSGIYRVVIYNGACTDSTAAHWVSLIQPVKSTITKTGNILQANLGKNYQWFLNGQYIPNANSQNYRPNTTGNYTVLVTDSFQCGWMSDTMYISLGTTDQYLNGVTVFPNPCKDIFTIQFQEFQTLQYILSDIQGKTLENNQISKQTNVSLTTYPAGIYILNIISGNRSGVFKIIKQ